MMAGGIRALARPTPAAANHRRRMDGGVAG